MVNITVPTFEEYIAHLDRTLEKDLLLLRAKSNEQYKRYYPESSNFGIFTNVPIDVVRLLKKMGYSQKGEDVYCGASVGLRELGRQFIHPNLPRIYYAGLTPYEEEFYYNTEDEGNRHTVVSRKYNVGKTIAKVPITTGRYHFHSAANDEDMKKLPDYIKSYPDLGLTEREFDWWAKDLKTPHFWVSLRKCTKTLRDLLEGFTKLNGSSICRHINMPYVVAVDKIDLKYDDPKKTWIEYVRGD